MNAEPFFSVIIPTYNRADLILKTVRTVLGQSFSDFEVLIIDNHSTDNTAALIAKEINDERVTFIQHDKNYERARSRNTGLEKAKGTFVTFLDSDDFMYPNNLRDAHQFHRDHPGCLFFHNLYELVDGQGNCRYRYPAPSLEDPLKQIAIGNFLSCIGVFVHRELYEKVRFNESPDLTGSEDWELWLRLVAQVKKVGRINKVNSGILDHAGRTVNRQVLDQLIQRKQKIISLLQNEGFYADVYRPYFELMRTNVFIHAAIVSNSMGAHASAFRLLRRALRMDISQLFKTRFLKTFAHALLRK